MSRLTELTYYSQRMYDYLKNKFKGVSDRIDTLDSNTTSSFNSLSQRVQKNADDIVSNSNDIQNNSTAISDVDGKVVDLKSKVDTLETEVGNVANGDTLYINDVEPYIFRNVLAGETVQIPNTNYSTDFMVECYTEVDQGTVIDYTVINLNEANKDKFIYDPEYVDVASDGVKPKDNVLIDFTKASFVYNGTSYDTFTSEVIPNNIVDTIESIITITEETI